MTQAPVAPLPISCIVAIGASAGGVNALKDLLSKMESSRLSFVVIQHLEPSGIELALEVLRAHSQLPVQEIYQGLTIQAGVIHLARPHVLVSIENGVFAVQPTEGIDQRRSTIDHFMNSLADEAQQKCIGVVLSGEGSDGTEGLRAIGDAGGMTIAQDPLTTDHRSMPESAIRLATVDHILPVEAMAVEIQTYEKFLLRLLDQTRIHQIRDQISSALGSICDILYRATGHDFKHYKTNTLVRRIQRRMQILQLADVESYLEKLQTQTGEIDSLFKELLINVTSFFRDPIAFEELRATVLEKALAKHPGHQKYRIWIAGCSTGEEAYTIAIIVREILDSLKNPPEVQIIATDIDEVALNAARRGTYSASIAEDITSDRLARYFVRKGGRYVVSKELREMCLFSSHNLINDPPFSQIDLLTCRNVLIYLGPHLQQKLIPVFHYSLRPQGFLFLGTSESLSGHQELFRTVSARYRIAQRRTTAIRAGINISALGPSHLNKPLEPMPTSEVDLNLIAQRIILDEFTPRYAVVNEEGQLVSVSAGLNRFLEPSEGLFHNNLMKLAKPSLRTALRSVFNSAKKHKRKFTNEHSTIESDEGLIRIGVTVQPMPQLGEHLQLFMVIFQYLGQMSKVEGVQAGSTSSLASVAAVEQLERELTLMREDLDKTVQDLEASNEELKSSNEELLSMNEELQSANEELETSKEDVQAANDALQRANSDLENLLAGTDIATLFLDESNRIKSFTPALTRFYPILATDIGRSINDFTPRAEVMPELPTRRELEGGKATEVEIATTDDKRFLRRIIPYKTHEGKFEGLVVIFIDITELRKVEVRFQTLANLVPSMTWMANAQGEIFYLNARWFEYTGAQVGESQGSALFEYVHPDDVDAFRQFWAQATSEAFPFQKEIRLRKQDGDYRWFELRGVATQDARGRVSQWFGICSDIHDKRAEVDFLKENTEGLQKIVETIPQYIWRTKADGAVDYCSESFTQYSGLSLEQARGSGWMGIVHPDDLESVIQIWADARAEKRPVSVDFRIKVQGETRWVRAEGNPYFNSQGQITQYYGTWTDISIQVATERGRQEALELYELETRKFEALFADSPSAMALFKGEELVVEKANVMFQQIIGSRLFVGQTTKELFQDRPESPYPAILRNVFLTGLPYYEREVPVTVPAESGFSDLGRFMDVAYQRINDSQGNPYGVFLHASDVTDQVKARTALFESEARFRDLANAMPQIVFTADADGNINYFNDRWEEFTGYTYEQTKDWGWGPVLHPEDLQRTVDTWTHAVKNIGPYEIEYRLKSRDGSYRWHLGRAVQVPVSVDRVTRWFGTNTDIHDVKVLTQELAAAKQNAESANQIKSRFLANMSHEIRTPLGVIIGFTDLVKEQLHGNRDVESYVERIVTNAKQLGALIDEILDLSKIEADRLEADVLPFHLKDLVSEVFSGMGMLAREKGLVFEESWKCADPGTVRTDPNRFRQILINIIGNAIKFTDQGSVKVSLDVEGDDDKRLLLVRVKDTGIGLTPDQSAHIFQPFMQADTSVTRRFGGTGLGLALSQKLAVVLGGELKLEESTFGKGSTFVASIAIGPKVATPKSIAARATKAKSGFPILGPKVKVLIVDDSPDNRAIVGRFLKLAGANFDEAENGQIALEKALAEPYSVILMDIQMPVMDGYEALRQLRESKYRQPIVALTAHAMKEEKDRCLEAGFDSYLSKPVDRQVLLRLIKELTHS